jgi:hypothetical protein
MAPTAIYTLSSDPIVPQVKKPLLNESLHQTVKGPALAIGSSDTAQDGKYQSLVSRLDAQSGQAAERQMLDRLLDGGIFILRSYSSSTY